jgi:steroid Delta-isomerase
MTTLQESSAPLAAPVFGVADEDRAASAHARAVRFYDCVDSGDIEAMAALFGDETVYHRPGYEPMPGRAAITDFYLRRRLIKAGRHTLSSILAQATQVAVVGEYHGVLHSGDPVDLRFADLFHLNAEGAFCRRETFFFAPLA